MFIHHWQCNVRQWTLWHLKNPSSSTPESSRSRRFSSWITRTLSTGVVIVEATTVGVAEMVVSSCATVSVEACVLEEGFMRDSQYNVDSAASHLLISFSSRTTRMLILLNITIIMAQVCSCCHHNLLQSMMLVEVSIPLQHILIVYWICIEYSGAGVQLDEYVWF